MAARLINAVFQTRCAKCAGRIPEGARAWYDKAQPKGRRTTHEDCGQPARANVQRAAQHAGAAAQDGAGAAQAAQQAGAPAQAAARSKDAAADLAARFPEYGQVHAFDDVESLLRAAENPRSKNGGWRDWHDGTGMGSADWYGLGPELAGTRAALPDVARVVREGWTRGAERIQGALDGFTVEAKPRSIRRTRTRRDFGAEVDMTEYWRGRGDVAWTDCTRAMRPARVHYTIVNDAIESGASDSDSMFWRGAAVVALADKLTTAGYSVRVVSAWHAPDNGGLVCYTVCKPFDAPIDVPTLAASCANPGFFRCIGHCWGNGTEDQPDNCGHGYRVKNWPAHPGEILASNAEHWDADKAHDWVAQQIAAIEAASNGE
jgi:hypothetical protein